jgi:hypothetical protein
MVLNPTHRSVLEPVDGPDKCEGYDGEQNACEGGKDKQSPFSLQTDPRHEPDDDARGTWSRQHRSLLWSGRGRGFGTRINFGAALGHGFGRGESQRPPPGELL